MSIWTRLAEAVSSVTDSLGEILRKLTQPRARAPEKTMAFTIGMIALGAKMAKADGVVTEAEVRAFRQVFHVPDAELPAVARVFNLARQDVAGFDYYAKRVARLFKARSVILEDVLDGLFHIAKADTGIHPAEIEFLRAVAEIFGFSAAEFRSIQARHTGEAEADPYHVMGLAQGASLDAIRQRYRKLVRENHPDKHIAAGMPAEMVSLATSRLQKINEAYALILKERTA
ncbi:MAG: DnaJ family molecular chaperone [Alphaproteobacteria bacterium]|nr:DnaJ family molecular chaperone [Alphaproteobacteria bacterium]